jgi:hypothetical protein
MSRPIVAAAQYVEPAVAVSYLDIAVAASVRYVGSQQDVRVRASVSVLGAAQVASVSVLHAEIDAGELDAGAQSASAHANVIAHEAHAIALGGAARAAVAHAAQMAVTGHRAVAERSAALAMASVVSHAVNAAGAFSNEIVSDFFLRFVERLHDSTTATLDSIIGFLVEKVLADSVAPGDARAFDIVKPVTDSATALEAILVVVFRTAFIYQWNTAVLNGGGQMLATIDGAANGWGLNGSVLHASDSGDEVLASDYITSIDFGKALTDLPVATDALSSIDTSLGKSDSAAPADAKAVDFVQGTTSDAVTPVDGITGFAFDYNKAVMGWTSAVLNGGFWSLIESSFALNDAPLHGGDLGDEVLASDHITSFDVGLGKTDATAATDAISTFDTSLGKSDSVAPTESKAVDFIQGTQADSVTPSDFLVAGFDYDKQVIGWTSAVLNGGFFSLINSSFTLNDSPLHGGDLGDEVLASDYVSAIDTSLSKSDSVTPSEAAVVDMAVAKSESVTPTEAAVVDFSKPLSDSATPSDSIAIDFQKASSDSVAPDDSGFSTSLDVSHMLNDPQLDAVQLN